MNSPDILTVDYDSPCGRLTLGACGGRLCMCDWHGGRPRVVSRLTRLLHASVRPGATAVTDEARRRLDRCFGGRSDAFDLPLLTVGTSLQLAVRQAISQVPRGSVATYADLAARIGRPAAVRAVATATADNALSLFIPCHRIISADGSVRYAGGSDAKTFLLNLEK